MPAKPFDISKYRAINEDGNWWLSDTSNATYLGPVHDETIAGNQKGTLWIDNASGMKFLLTWQEGTIIPLPNLSKQTATGALQGAAIAARQDAQSGEGIVFDTLGSVISSELGTPIGVASLVAGNFIPIGEISAIENVGFESVSQINPALNTAEITTIEDATMFEDFSFDVENNLPFSPDDFAVPNDPITPDINDFSDFNPDIENPLPDDSTLPEKDENFVDNPSPKQADFLDKIESKIQNKFISESINKLFGTPKTTRAVAAHIRGTNQIPKPTGGSILGNVFNKQTHTIADKNPGSVSNKMNRQMLIILFGIIAGFFLLALSARR